MNRIIEWFAENGVAANVLMIAIIAGGLLAIPTVKKEVFPETAIDMISVTVPYLGAAPEEVESGVCLRIEEAVQGLEGIDRLVSTAAEGVCNVLIEAETGYNMRVLLDEVQSRVDAIDTFPEQTERPVVREIIMRQQVLSVAIAGNVSEATLKRVGEQVRDEIASLPGVTTVELTNVRPYEVSIEVSEATLRRHNLTFDQVAQAVRQASLDLPGGAIDSERGEILLRTQGQAYIGPQFASLVLLTQPDGSRLTIGDVATVRDGFAETHQRARFDGKPAVMVDVFRVGDQNVLELAETVHQYVAAARDRYPDNLEFTVWRDSSQLFRDRLELLVRNGLTGLLLVYLLLALFLRFRLAFWVTLGIPISFLGAIWLMPIFDVSVNMVSLFAFILVLGIVVDDAIVVGENVYARQQRGERGLTGAIRGAQEMMAPVTFAIVTTVVAFAPLLFIPGPSGRIWQVIPLIVIPCLLFSLVEALLILPEHLSRSKVKPQGEDSGLNRFTRLQRRFSAGVARFAETTYRRHLERALQWRYLTLASGLAVLLVTWGIIGGGWVRFVFLPNVESEYVIARVTMPQGTLPERTELVLQQLEDAARAVEDELETENGDVIRHILTSVGDQPVSQAQARMSGIRGATVSGSHLGEIVLELMPSAQRTVSSEEVSRRWRERAGPVPEAREVSFDASLFSAGAAIDVQLTGPDLERLQAAADELKARLGGFAGVFDITDSFEQGKEQLQLDIRPEAQHLNLRLADLGRQVRQAFYGEEAQRVQRGREDVRVMVRYTEAERRTLGALEEMRIRTADGHEVPFSSVAQVEAGRGYATIRRVDRRRAINVTADVDTATANANQIVAELQQEFLPALVHKHPGVRYDLEGEQREQQDALRALAFGLLYALLAIFALLAIAFRSYVQPIIVMSAVPFGMVGATVGHLLMGMPLSLLSMSGMVALAGVVVNDSLILVDYVNRRRSEGMALMTAVRQAGVARFRPVLLTSLTTFAGLAPLLMERSLQAQFLIPMANALAFGVLFATAITLLLVPCGYLVLHDVRNMLLRAAGREPEEEAPGPGEPVAERVAD